MKRYIALFTATLILVANCIVYTPVKAVGTSVDFAEMFSEYLSLAEMSMALTQGVEIDWSGFEFDDNATNQEKAKALMNYYYGLIYNGLDYFLDLSGNQDVISEQMVAIALQTSGNLSSENILDLRSQVASALQNYAVTENWNIPIMQHYDDLCIANWNKYNSMFINEYLSNLDETVRTDYPADTNRINLCSISAPNQSNINFTCIGYDAEGFSFDYHGTTYNNLHYPFIVEYDDGDTSWDYFYVVGKSLNPNDGYGFPPNPNAYWYPMQGGIARATINTNYPIFFNITDAIAYSQSGYVISGGHVAVSVPDAVIDNSTDDGKIVSHPIFYPDAVKLDGLVNIDLDAVRDTIIDAISQGRTSITMDDVVDAGAAVKADGTTLTDADTKTVDASIPIEAAKADTLTVPINAIPGLPKLPPIVPSGGDSVPNGFSGMSVLARIINVTVQSVPEPLIMCFFGVIFGMVVLGIIKILHH